MEIVAIISIISVLAWFIFAYKNSGDLNSFDADDIDDKE